MRANSRARRRVAKKGASPSRTALFCLLLVAAVAALYANSLSHGFVFDDVTLIQQNPDVLHLNWERILGRSGYRPVRTLTYALNYAVGGLHPFGYHLFNLILHAANSVLIFLFLRAVLGKTEAGFLGGLLFAVHPVQTAAVGYVSGRKDLLATFFLMLAALWFIQWRRDGARGRLILAGSAILLAVFSKEVAVVFPALVLLLDLCVLRVRTVVRQQRGLISALKSGALFYSLVLGLALAAVYYAIVWTEASRMAGYWGGSLLNQWATSFKLFVHYLRLALFPYPLIADYTGVFPVSSGLTEPSTLLCLIVSVAYVAAALRLYRDRPLVTLGMGWFLVSLLPVLQIVGFHEIAADHFLYLPMVGVALVFGDIGARGLASRNFSVLLGALLLSIFVLFSFLTVTRNRVWADQVTLWEDTYSKAPESYRANANLGQLYFERFQKDPKRNSGLRREAIRLSERAAELNPEDSLPLSNLGAIFREWGWDQYKQGNEKLAEELEERALEYLLEAVSLDPENVWNHSNLGDVRKDLGMIWQRRGDPVRAESERQAAIQAYQRGIGLGSPNPRFPLVRFKVAMVKVDQRRFDEAVVWLQRPVAAPGLSDMWEVPFWLGFCYLATGRVDEAVPHLRRSVNIAPRLPGLRLLAYALEGLGESEEALRLYRQALARNPDSYETHLLLGVAFREKGNEEAALQHLERASQLVEKNPATASTEAYRRSIELALEHLREGSSRGGVRIEMVQDPGETGRLTGKRK